MTTVTLHWDDPEDAARFAEFCWDYRRDGWLPDPSAGRVWELIASATAVRKDEDHD